MRFVQFICMKSAFSKSTFIQTNSKREPDDPELKINHLAIRGKRISDFYSQLFPDSLLQPTQTFNQYRTALLCVLMDSV